MSSKIHYRSVKENDDYLLIDGKIDIALMTMSEDISVDVYSELQSIYFKMFLFERTSGIGYIDEPIAIRKDSIVGRYIISHPEICLDDDKDITYKKVVDAYSVATYSKNLKMANKILPLFMGRISGSRDELGDICSLTVLDYILDNGNFDEYLEKLDGKVDNGVKEYIVYEDGEYSKKTLENEKGKAKVKN